MGSGLREGPAAPTGDQDFRGVGLTGRQNPKGHRSPPDPSLLSAALDEPCIHAEFQPIVPLLTWC